MKEKLSLVTIQTVLIGVLFLLINGCKKESENPQIQTVTTGYITNIKPTSAYCSGNVYSGEGGVIDTRGICYSNVVTVPTVNDDHVEWGSFYVGNFSFPLNDLTPGTTYYVRAFVQPWNSVPIYGNVISFVTTGSITGDIIFNPNLTYGSVTDIDGNTYKTIEIGTQTWIAENLKTTKFNDGTSIPNVTDLTAWRNLTTPAYCWYINDGAIFKKTYGALYNSYAVNTTKLCPTGWHLPSQTEWMTLITFLGGDSIAGRKLKETGTAHWIITSADVTNSSGFTGLPGGVHMVDATIPRYYFRDMGYYGYFWSSTLVDVGGPFPPALFVIALDGRFPNIRQLAFEQNIGSSVRCIKD